MRAAIPSVLRRGGRAVLAPAAILAGVVLLASPVRACTTDYLIDLQRVRGDLDTANVDIPADISQLRATESRNQAADALDPVIRDLSAGDLSSAKGRLDATISVLRLPPNVVCNADSGPARDTLHRVYQSPVFSDLDKPASQEPGLLQRLLDALSGFLRRVAGTLGTAGTILVAAVILGLLIALAVWRLRQVSAAGRRAAVVIEPAGDGGDPHAEWRLGLEAAGRGEYREAIRRAFRSALLSVAARGRLPIDPSWTTRELLLRATRDAELVALLAPAAAAFDHAWYSGDAVDASEWEQARSRCEAIRGLAEHRVVAA